MRQAWPEKGGGSSVGKVLVNRAIQFGRNRDVLVLAELIKGRWRHLWQARRERSSENHDRLSLCRQRKT
jgi:hypothetical protein